MSMTESDQITILDLEDPYFHGQTLPDALRDYAHVHSATGICVKRAAGPMCADPTAGDGGEGVRDKH